MKVSDILRVKGNTLYTVPPEQSLGQALRTMAELDIGSLCVMSHGDLAGMLTFREVIKTVVKNSGQIGATLVRSAAYNVASALSLGMRIEASRRARPGIQATDTRLPARP